MCSHCFYKGTNKRGRCQGLWGTYTCNCFIFPISPTECSHNSYKVLNGEESCIQLAWQAQQPQLRILLPHSGAKLALLPLIVEAGEQLLSVLMRLNRNRAKPDIFSNRAFIQVPDDVKNNHHPSVKPKKAFGCLPWAWSRPQGARGADITTSLHSSYSASRVRWSFWSQFHGVSLDCNGWNAVPLQSTAWQVEVGTKHC